MIDKQSVGKRIAACRTALGYSQAAFAEKLNVTTQAVSKWETGVSLPNIEKLLHISWIAKTSINVLLDGTYPEYLDRGLGHISRRLVCPACRKPLQSRLVRPEQPCFICDNGHRYRRRFRLRRTRNLRRAVVPFPEKL